MKLFSCQNCEQIVYFENTHCENCGYALGFSPDRMDILTLIKNSDNAFNDITDKVISYKYCANNSFQACNWVLPKSSANDFCRSCALNRTVPDLSITGNLALWQRVEAAKQRLIYTLIRLDLPVDDAQTRPGYPLRFDFLCGTRDQPVMTGHKNGLITLNVLEADKLVREQTKVELGEHYRTLTGHFRHEIGHFYWERLVAKNDARLKEFRYLFGDERQDYQKALNEHYREKDSGDWKINYISHYASAHPWEDWAETWAHYLHILDSLETAYSYGLQLRPRVDGDTEYHDLSLTEDPFLTTSVDQLVDQWLPLAGTLNSMSRSMGQTDLYPFILSPVVIDKLKFIHALI